VRIYVPHGAGLGSYEISAMRRLSRESLGIIAEELRHPGSWSTVREVLRARDVEAAVVRQVAEEIERAVAAIETVRYAGLGDDEWDEMELVDDVGFSGFFKKIGKKIKSVAKKVVSVHKKVFEKTIKPAVKATVKVAKKTVEVTKKTVKKVHELKKKVIKKIGKAIKPYIPIILTVVGAVLAPFTGGASLAVAAALNAGYAIAMKAKEAKAAKKMAKKEAAAMQAEVDAASADLGRQLDELFQQNQAVFTAAGISASQWAGMSVEQRLAVVERINAGQMPSSQENATAAAEDQGQEPPTQTQTWRDAIQSSPVMQQWGEAAGDTDTAAAGVQTPTGVYDVWVEGRKVGSASSLSEASGILAANSKVGDRVEMTLDGRSLGLKIVTSGGGVISVPPELVEQVQSASREQVDGIISRATQSASAVTTSSSGGGGGLWAVLIGAGALALMAGGK
jgi:hypothetical protein